MTESEQTQSLQAAFPTEPVRPELSQRIENLTPLTPTVTGYKLKFRHVFAVFAVLWIGHNVPVALKAWTASEKRQEHRQDWVIQPDGKRVLEMETWAKDGKFKIHIYKTSKKYPERISIFTNEINYNFNGDSKTLEITKHEDLSRISKYDNTANIIATCLFRTYDTRPKAKDNNKIFVAREYWASNDAIYDPDPETPIIASTKLGKNYIREVTRGVAISDALFEPNFPPGTKIKNVPDSSIPPPSLFAMFRNHVERLLSRPHP